MKISIVSIGSFDTQYSDYHIIRDIIIELLERGHEVNLIQKQYLKNPNYPEEFNNYIGNKLYINNIFFKKKKKQNFKSRYLADLFYYVKVCRLIRKNKPDKIFLQSNNTSFYPVFYAKYILKIPLLYNEQDIFPENAKFAGMLSEKSYFYKFLRLLQKFTYQNSTELTTISYDMKSTIVNKYNILSEDIRVVFNWGHEELEPVNFKTNKFLKLYPKKDSEFRVVYAGNIGKMQNVELLLKTANLMIDYSDIKFFIVGDGTNKKNLKEFAIKHNLVNVFFIDMLPPKKILDLYSASDINIIPLAKEIIFAALPSKTADCLISNKPIITCLDFDSKFASLLEKYSIDNAGTDDPLILKDKILKIKKSNLKGDNLGLLRDYFTKERNVKEHCNIIEQMR